MKLTGLIAAVLLAVSALVSAHEGNEHVRGVVTAVSARSISVQVSEKDTKTLTLNDKTVFLKSGKPAHLEDLKVGDRVVVDVPEKTTEAKQIQFGAPAKK
jgi:hypothetical protein